MRVRREKRPLTSACLEPSSRRVEKPWGWEIVWAEAGAYTGKLIHVRAGLRLSLQYHDQKIETQCLVSGKALLVAEDVDGILHEILMERGLGYTIQPFQLHRFVAIEEFFFDDAATTETGTTVRVEDDYRRDDETEEMRTLPNRGWLEP